MNEVKTKIIKRPEELVAEAFAFRQSLAPRLENDDYYDDIIQAEFDALSNAMVLPRVERVLLYKKILDAISNKWLAEPLSKQQLKEKWNGGEEDLIGDILGNMRLHLGTYHPEIQQDILIFLLNEMPEKLRESEEEETICEAIDKLTNFVDELPYNERMIIYSDFMEQVKTKKAIAVPA